MKQLLKVPLLLAALLLTFTYAKAGFMNEFNHNPMTTSIPKGHNIGKATCIPDSTNGNYVPPKDSLTYNTSNGISCKNKWFIGRNHCEELFWIYFTYKQLNYRTATIDPKRKQVYMGLSKEVLEDSVLKTIAHLVILDLETGKYKKDIALHYNNTNIPITGTNCANQIGVDDFGNVWVAEYNEKYKSPTKVYIIEDLETGACHQIEWSLPADERANAGRTDCYDVIGDITGKQANAIAMSTAFTYEHPSLLYRWELEKGTTEWKGGFNGKVSATVTETFPKTYNGLGACSVVKIVKDNDSDFSGSRFYIDGTNSYPALYDTSLTILHCFSECHDFNNFPDTHCNGITEFELGNKKFIAFAESDIQRLPGHRINICELGENGSFEGMKYYWSVPETGLGNYSSGGLRQHSIETHKVIDKNGKEGVYLLSYAINNGIGLYFIAEEGFEETDISSTEKIEADNIAMKNEATEVARYDIHGRLLMQPAKGINIVKMSDGTTHKVIVK